MATPPALMQLAFAAGLDESQHDEVLDPMAAFPVLQNGRQEKRGGYSKRLGYDSLVRTRLDATSRSAGNRLFSHRDQVCVADGSTVDVYSPTLAANVSRGRYPEASFTVRHTSTMNASCADIAYCGGYVAYAHVVGSATDAKIYLAVEDATSGELIRAPELAFTTSFGGFNGNVALGTYSTYIVAIFIEEAGPIIAKYLNTASAATINTGWVAFGASIGVDNIGIGSAYVTLSVQSLTDRIAFAYVNASAGASQLTVKTITIAGVLETATVNTSSVTPDDFAIEGSIADTLWVAWNETTTVKMKGLDADVLATTLATTASILTLADDLVTTIGIISSATAGKGRIICNDSLVGSLDRLQMRGFQTSGGAAAADGSQVTVPNAYCSCRPFRVGTRYYATFLPSNAGMADRESAHILCDFTENQSWLRPVANVEPSLAGSPTRMHVQALSATKYIKGINVTRSTVAVSTALVTFDFADPDLLRSAPFGGSTVLTGGMTSCFDGKRVSELGFLFRPTTPTGTIAGTGITGTYRYVVVYEEVDANGVWWQSGVSNPSALISPSNDTVTLVLRPLSITARQVTAAGPEVRLAIYRTADGGEAPYYRLAAVNNDTSAVSTSYADTTDDTILTANAVLYSQPGIQGTAQDRRAPPGLKHLVQYNGMLVGASGGDLWYSGQAVSGEGAWFNPLFQIPVAADALPVTGLAVLDGTLYVFRSTDVYAVSGEPPSDNGSTGGLGTPRQLSSDVGCIEGNSVVSTSVGIFFLSDRGIELLSRSGSVDWIGERVQTTLASYPIVSSAVLDERNALVRFTLAAAESGARISGNGRDIVFDLSLKTWIAVDDKTGAGAHEASQDAAAVYVGGVWRYAWLSASGIVYYEKLSTDATAHLDGSTWVTLAGETASFKSSGIQGRQHLNRVLVLARKATDCNLAVSLSYNHETTFRTARTFTRAEINALLTAGWPVTQLKHEPHDDAECQGFRVRLEDATPTGGTVGSGKGQTWLALTMDVTPKPGAFEVPEEAA